MEFEQMQVIWNQQNNEKLFAINESALFDKVKEKSKDANWILNFFEAVFIGISFFLVLFYLWKSQRSAEQFDEYISAAVMLFVGIFVLVSRIRRKRSEAHFEPSILGEVNKAIWRVDQIISYGRSAMYWFLIPVGLTYCGIKFYEGSYWSGIGYLLFLAAIEVGLRQETRKLHLPKKQDLEALKELIVAEN